MTQDPTPPTPYPPPDLSHKIFETLGLHRRIAITSFESADPGQNLGDKGVLACSSISVIGAGETASHPVIMAEVYRAQRWFAELKLSMRQTQK
jgi:hypothetical protein